MARCSQWHIHVADFCNSATPLFAEASTIHGIDIKSSMDLSCLLWVDMNKLTSNCKSCSLKLSMFFTDSGIVVQHHAKHNEKFFNLFIFTYTWNRYMYVGRQL